MCACCRGHWPACEGGPCTLCMAIAFFGLCAVEHTHGSCVHECKSAIKKQEATAETTFTETKEGHSHKRHALAPRTLTPCRVYKLHWRTPVFVEKSLIPCTSVNTFCMLRAASLHSIFLACSKKMQIALHTCKEMRMFGRTKQSQKWKCEQFGLAPFATVVKLELDQLVSHLCNCCLRQTDLGFGGFALGATKVARHD